MKIRSKLTIVVISSLLTIAFGVFIKGFVGGLLCGFATSLLIFYLIGKASAEQSIRRIDKKLMDLREQEL